MTSAALNFVGGIPFQLLYDSVKMAIHKTRKFKTHLKSLQFTLDCLEPLIIERIGDNNVQLNLPNNIIEGLQTKMEEGKDLVDMLLNLSMWNIRIWGNCYNYIGPNYAEQLGELDRSIRILMGQLELEQRRTITELLILGRNTRDKQDELDKKLEKIYDILMAPNNATGRMSSNTVQPVASSSGGGGGAAPAPALGVVFQQLFDVVRRVKVKNMMFKRLFKRFESTLYCSQPLIEEISKCNKVLHLPKEQVEYFVDQSVELVHKFSEVHKRANYDKCTYTKIILNLNDSLQRLFIRLKGQVERDVKRTMDSANKIEAVIKKIEGGGWAQNINEFGSEGQSRRLRPPGLDVLNMPGPSFVIEETVLDLARLKQEMTKPIEGSHVLQNQIETDSSREAETLDSITRNIEVGIMETEGTEVVVSTRDVQETMKGALEIAVAETEPPSPTIGSLDVHGPRDVKGTLGSPRNVIEAGVLKQIEGEIATAEPLSSLPAVGLTLDSTSNTKAGLKQPEEKKEKGRPLPKFGEWDSYDPASAEGFTVIFNEAGDEKIHQELTTDFRFYPTEEELVSFYLNNKLESKLEDSIRRVIPDLDIYGIEPWDLPKFAAECCGDTEQWFFFTPMQQREAQGGRPNRTTASGYWKATGSPGYVYSSDNRVIGVKKTMVFYKGKAPTGRKTKWKMNEYRAIEAVATSATTSNSATTAIIPKLRNEFRLCRVYVVSGSSRAFDRRPLEARRDSSRPQSDIMGASTPSSHNAAMVAEKTSSSSETHHIQEIDLADLQLDFRSSGGINSSNNWELNGDLQQPLWDGSS